MALRDKLMRRDLFEDFCREYVRELNRLRMEHHASLSHGRHELAAVEREMLAMGLLVASPHPLAQAVGRDAFARLPGVTLHYVDWGGNGPVLLFLTGLGDSAHAFDTGAQGIVACTARYRGRSGAAAASQPCRSLPRRSQRWRPPSRMQKAVLRPRRSFVASWTPSSSSRPATSSESN